MLIFDEWRSFLQQRMEEDIAAIIEAEKLKPEETRRFLDNAFRDGTLKTTGTAFDKIMSPMYKFYSSDQEAKKLGVIDKRLGFFEKYFDLG